MRCYAGTCLNELRETTRVPNNVRCFGRDTHRGLQNRSSHRRVTSSPQIAMVKRAVSLIHILLPVADLNLSQR
jgi:uncharacterized protein (UPF0147 family)